MYNNYEEEKLNCNKKIYNYIFNYNSKNGTSLINTSNNLFMNKYHINLGNDFGGKNVNVILKEMNFLITQTPTNPNCFDFIPKSIYIKFDNVVDIKSDYISNDGYFFDGILSLEQKFEVQYLGEIEWTYRYKLISPIKRTINQPRITMSFWIYDDRNTTVNSSVDGKSSLNSLIINYNDLIQNYNGNIPTGMNGLNLLGYLSNPKNIIIDGLNESYIFTNVINLNGEFKIIS